MIIPLKKNYDRPDVYAYNAEDNSIFSARGFLKNNDLMPDETTRYAPEWDEDLGSDATNGGFRIALNQDGEVVTVDSADNANSENSDNNTASTD